MDTEGKEKHGGCPEALQNFYPNSVRTFKQGLRYEIIRSRWNAETYILHFTLYRIILLYDACALATFPNIE